MHTPEARAWSGRWARTLDGLIIIHFTPAVRTHTPIVFRVGQRAQSAEVPVVRLVRPGPLLVKEEEPAPGGRVLLDDEPSGAVSLSLNGYVGYEALR
jgi:hypothetical protein